MSKRKVTKSRNGTGSLFQRKDGQWAASVRYTAKDGTRKRKVVYGRTRAEAQRKMEQVRSWITDDRPVEQSTDTLATFLHTWTQTSLAVSSRRESTKQTYETVLGSLVIPHLGDVKLADLTASLVEDWMRGLIGEGKSAATVRKAADVLAMAIDGAVRDDLLRSNVVRSAQKPYLGRSEVRFYSSRELAAIREAAAGHRMASLLEVAAYTGLRKGELLALRWRDVDLDGQQLRITGSLSRVRGRLVRQEPKTNAGTRVVPLIAPALAGIQAAREQQDSDRAAFTGWTNPADYVFTTPSGEPVDPSNLGRWFRKVTAAARLRSDDGNVTQMRVTDGSWHTLRHSAASNLLRAGVPMIVVSRLLGHSKIQITIDLYGHLTNSDIADAVTAGFTGYGEQDGGENVVPLRAVNL